MIQRIEHTALDGSVTVEEIEVPDPIPDPGVVPVLDAISTARTEVSALSPTGPTRLSVEALCTAVETLIGGTP